MKNILSPLFLFLVLVGVLLEILGIFPKDIFSDIVCIWFSTLSLIILLSASQKEAFIAIIERDGGGVKKEVAFLNRSLVFSIALGLALLGHPFAFCLTAGALLASLWIFSQVKKGK